MGKASGAALILAGVAISAVAYLLPPAANPDDHEPAPTHGDVANTPAGPIAPGAWRHVAAAPEEAEAAPVSTVVVTLPTNTPPTTVPQTVPRDRASLARELQGELKRVGCYGGEINGTWTTSTRQAMKEFTDRVNASLPTDQPDSILLTMVRGYQDKVCGKPCPTGQGLSDGGRCVPNAILVRGTTKPSAPVAAAAPTETPAPAITGWTTSTTVAPTPLTAQGEGPMALAGPSGDVPAAPGPGAGPQPASVTRKPVTNPDRFGTRIFKQFDRMGGY